MVKGPVQAKEPRGVVYADVVKSNTGKLRNIVKELLHVAAAIPKASSTWQDFDQIPGSLQLLQPHLKFISF